MSRIWLALALGLLLVASQRPGAYGTTFSPAATVSLASSEAEAPSDILMNLSLGAPDSNLGAIITFTPSQWTVASDAEVPNGAVVGNLSQSPTIAVANGPCDSQLLMSFVLWDASTDTSSSISPEQGFNDANGNDLPDAVDNYLDFLQDLFPGLTPRARYYGQATISGANFSVNVLIFAPGTSLSGFPEFDVSLGFPSVIIFWHPTPLPEPITEFCTPLAISYTTFGLSGDNPSTKADESNWVVRRNPTSGGTYTFTTYARSLPDADDDGIENSLDTCPYSANSGDPRVGGSGDADGDGLDAACDPNDAEALPDEDDDGLLNREDNCPLESNADQTDTDMDGIGDLCDQNPSTIDGHRHETFMASSLAVGLDSDGDGIPDDEDNCPQVSNPDQANTDADLEAQGASITGDSLGDACDDDDDNDGFTDSVENYLPTNGLDNCPGSPGSGGDAWPLDNNADKAANVIDVLNYRGQIPSSADTPSKQRLDLNADYMLNVLDVLIYKGKTPSVCN